MPASSAAAASSRAASRRDVVGADHDRAPQAGAAQVRAQLLQRRHPHAADARRQRDEPVRTPADRLRDREHASLREAAEDTRRRAELRLGPVELTAGDREVVPAGDARREQLARAQRGHAEARLDRGQPGLERLADDAHAAVQREQDAVALPFAQQRRLDVLARLRHPPLGDRDDVRETGRAAGGLEVGVLAEHRR